MVDTLGEDDVSERLQPGSLLEGVVGRKQSQNLGVEGQTSAGDQIGLPNHILVAVQRTERSAGFQYAWNYGGDIPRIHSRVECHIDAALAQ